MSKIITKRWKVFRTACFAGAVAEGDARNPSAHGWVTDWELRRDNVGRIQGRKVNRNGSHVEIGEPIEMSADEARAWGARP